MNGKSSMKPGAEEEKPIRLVWEGPGGGRVEAGGEVREFLAVVRQGVVWVHLGGKTFRFDRQVERSSGEAGQHRGREEADQLQRSLPRAPLPGTVIQVTVKEGDQIECGAHLATIAVMKMEHEVYAETDGRVLEVHVTEGNQVEEGDILVRIQPPA